MTKKNLLLVFIMCCMVLPVVTSAYQYVRGDNPVKITFNLFAEEEESGKNFPEKEKEEKEKDKKNTRFVFSSYSVGFNRSAFQFALEAGALLNGILDFPTPPPKNS